MNVVKESYVAQIDLIVAFDSVSDIGLIYKLKSLGASGGVLAIGHELLTDRRQQRVVVNGVIPVVYELSQISVIGSLFIIFYT